MIDYVKLVIYGCKDTINLSSCQLYSTTKYKDNYTISIGYEELKVHRKKQTGVIEIEGSLPYFYQGHNFTYSVEDYVNTIDKLQELLGIELWEAVVDEFEFGCIFPVEEMPVSYIRNHHAEAKARMVENEKGEDNGSFRWWVDKGDSKKKARKLKLYDAGKNIKSKVQKKIRDTIPEFVPERQYLKYELKTEKPIKLFGRVITAFDLQTTSFQNTLASKLKELYNDILIPMKELIRPDNKKQLSYSDIITLAYVEHLLNEGITIKDAKKKVYAFINHLSALNKSDKDSRKKAARIAFKALQEAPNSQWDLSVMINDALVAEGIPAQE